MLIDNAGAIWFSAPDGQLRYVRYRERRMTGAVRLAAPRLWLQVDSGRVLAVRPRTDSTSDVIEVLGVSVEESLRNTASPMRCGRSVRF